MSRDVHRFGSHCYLWHKPIISIFWIFLRKVIESSFWRKFIYFASCAHAYETWEQSQWITRTLTCKQKIWGKIGYFWGPIQKPSLFSGSKGGAVVRALASHQFGPGSNPSVNTICGLSLFLVLSLAPRGFSLGTPVFPSPQKLTVPNSNSTRNQVDKEPLRGCAACKSLFIIYFIYLFFKVLQTHLGIVKFIKKITQAVFWKIRNL